jgi:hypothetical protein
LVHLVETADHAYRRVRDEVFDLWPPGTAIDPRQLSDRQREAFSKHLLAEAELRAFREEQYFGQAVPFHVVSPVDTAPASCAYAE